MNPEGGHRQAKIREKKSPHKRSMEEFLEDARAHRQSAQAKDDRLKHEAMPGLGMSIHRENVSGGTSNLAG